MKTYACYTCGAEIIFRNRRKDKDGKEQPTKRPYPIHVNGDSCSGKS